MSLEIKLASTDELLDELFGRFTQGVFMGQQYNVHAKGDYIKKYKYQGDINICMGLCNQMNFSLNRNLETLEKNIDKNKK